MTRSFWRRTLLGISTLALLGGLGAVGMEEMRTSRLQSRLLSSYAKDMSFALRDGPNPAARYPNFGPYNERLGYTGLPGYLKALTDDMYAVEMQAHASPALDQFMAKGGFPIYHEKTRGGLTLLDRSGATLFSARYPERVFNRFEDVPPLVADTLLFIENRELLDTSEPRRNPAVEWERFGAAVLALPIQWIKPGTRSPGGSTLATQIEKYRHSPDGQTSGASEKLRQMASASVRAYLDGEDTTTARRRILIDYLNSTPLTGRPGFGEVNGLGDGLWAWYGTDLALAVKVLSEPAPDARTLKLKALAYKQVLSLMLAQRRPSHYLIADRGALERLADSYLRIMAQGGVIDPALRDAALATTLKFREEPPPAQSASFIEQKAPNAIRARLLSMLGVPSLYQLDRTDVTVETTLDNPTQQRVVETLAKLSDPVFAQQFGLTGDRLLEVNKGYDLSKIIYSITLYERGQDANYLRIQADNFDQPMDINEGAKLDLGSTAKLRTLTTYLEIVAELHTRYGHLPREFLVDVQEEAPDNLTRWAADWLMSAKDRGLPAMLDAAMERRYSANPGEAFFTGGGLHTFVNFNNKDNGSILTLTEALRNSVNLPFIRLMRDVAQFYTAEGGDDSSDILQNADHPARQAYLARFADKEGSEFLNRFYNDYRKRNPDEALTLLASRTRPAPHRLAVVFRYVRPEAGVDAFARFMRARLPDARLDDDDIAKLYSKYGPDKFPLNDLAYLARVHPLELWLVAYLQKNPTVKRHEVLDASADKRQESYKWLFKKGQQAQNTRIRIGLEEEAFLRIGESWKRLGYPFDLIPSFATAIGSSADRPAALAELMGIILNDGVRQPTVRVNKLHFAADTPYEAVVGLGPMAGKRVLKPEVAAALRKALMEVAQNGTAKRVWGSFKDASGQIIPIGGKTGTGDHRLDRYGPGGHLIESRAVNRTATFVFYIGERFFGTMTAFVHGPEADNYRFTSALPAQLLKSLAPALQPLIVPGNTHTADGADQAKPKPAAKL